jgi:hypothetical protein
MPATGNAALSDTEVHGDSDGQWRNTAQLEAGAGLHRVERVRVGDIPQSAGREGGKHNQTPKLKHKNVSHS